jgi:hypothetical protein
MGNQLSRLGLVTRSNKVYALESTSSSLRERLRALRATAATTAETDRLLRLRILDDAPIEFEKRTIILLFAPPDYGIESLAQFVSQKVNLPILRSPDVSSLGPRAPFESSSSSFNYADRLEFDVHDIQIMNEIESQLSLEKFSRGCILFDYPTSPKHYRFLCEVVNAQHIPFFFEIDPHVCEVSLRGQFKNRLISSIIAYQIAE